MDCSVYKEHKHTVTYGTNCSVWDTTWELLMQHTCLEPDFFYLIHQLGGTYAIMGSPMIALSSISLQAATLHMEHTQDHIHFELEF